MVEDQKESLWPEEDDQLGADNPEEDCLGAGREEGEVRQQRRDEADQVEPVGVAGVGEQICGRIEWDETRQRPSLPTTYLALQISGKWVGFVSSSSL